MNKVIQTANHNIIVTNDAGSSLTSYLLNTKPAFTSIFVISDENTHQECLPLIKNYLPGNTHHIVIGAGEINKNLRTCQIVWEQLLKQNAERGALIINLGGGLVSDLGGFIAATYKRGLRFINIPTSLLGMVDASSGGKTGIDLNQFKNMVGVFAFPETVIVDPVFLETLSDRDWINGIAEIIKHALISDKALWKSVREIFNEYSCGPIGTNIQADITNLLEQSIRVKAKIVSADPFEKKERLFLNFGHTVGHALETRSLLHDDNPLSHGEAIAAGMICESFLSWKLCGLKTEELSEISSFIMRLFPHKIIPGPAFQELKHLMKADKKSSSGTVNYALISEPGTAVLNDRVTPELLLESFHYYNSLHK